MQGFPIGETRKMFINSPVKNKKLPPTVFLCVYENKCVCVCECVSVCRSVFSGLKIVGNASQAKEYENEYEEGWLI